MATEKSVFEILSGIDCSEHIETKNGLSYLSWAWAWGYAKRRFPDARFDIYENADGLNYHTDGRTCWVKTGVTINGIELIEYLPVMDARNKSIPLNAVTSFDVNKAIQRSLTKALARHGLGLYIYAGEDLPVEFDDTKDETTAQAAPKPAKKKADKPAPASNVDAALLPGGERFKNAVMQSALGQNPPTGGTIRDRWIASINATSEQVIAFDQAVLSYKVEHNLM